MNQLTVSSAPHLGSPDRAWMRQLYWKLALAPPVVGAVWAFGLRAAAFIILGLAGALAGEFTARLLLARPLRSVTGRGSYWGVMVALLAPPGVPAGTVFLGGFLATFVAQEMYGGLGCALFHPALVGWMFLRMAAHAFGAGETENAMLYALGLANDVDVKTLSFLWGVRSGALAEAGLAMTALGGLVLLVKKLIRPLVPLAFLAGTALVTVLSGAEPAAVFLLTPAVWAAVFIATDPETTPAARTHMSAHALLSGMAFGLAARATGRPEAGLYALLVMNVVAPVWDKKQKKQGQGRSSAQTAK